ncbi:MAG: hypothetical protein EBU74_07280 [Betaproteobacteria bacterium]|nr:hypothetical protein [Betaproteobacteria bacterium]
MIRSTRSYWCAGKNCWQGSPSILLLSKLPPDPHPDGSPAPDAAPSIAPQPPAVDAVLAVIPIPE